MNVLDDRGEHGVELEVAETVIDDVVISLQQHNVLDGLMQIDDFLEKLHLSWKGTNEMRIIKRYKLSETTTFNKDTS